MQIEQTKPNKPSFLLVVLLSAGFLLLAFLIAAVILGTHKRNPVPFTKHPVSRLAPLPPAGPHDALSC